MSCIHVLTYGSERVEDLHRQTNEATGVPTGLKPAGAALVCMMKRANQRSQAKEEDLHLDSGLDNYRSQPSLYTEI